MIERLGLLEPFLDDHVLDLREHATTGREEHRDLAGLADLDDALAEARVIDAVTDLEPLARAIRP
jgi:hypothetical protein